MGLRDATFGNPLLSLHPPLVPVLGEIGAGEGAAQPPASGSEISGESDSTSRSKGQGHLLTLVVSWDLGAGAPLPHTTCSTLTCRWKKC